jgi:type IV pilus assembly protein PilO
MNDIIAKILRLKTLHKIGVTMGAMLVVGLIYYSLFYGDLEAEIQTAQSQSASLVTEKESYESRRSQYLNYRNELTRLQEEQREILKILPRKSEISSFLSSIQEQAEVSGVEIEVLTPEPELPEDLYVRIPVKIEVLGSYHSITKFFKNISELQRIVNLENVSLTMAAGGPQQDPEGTGRTHLKGKFITVTYKFAEQAGAGSQ